MNIHFLVTRNIYCLPRCTYCFCLKPRACGCDQADKITFVGATRLEKRFRLFSSDFALSQLPPTFAVYSVLFRGLRFPSALAGSHLKRGTSARASMICTSHTRYPSRICVLAPNAKRLAKVAGATALIPLISVRASAFSVPSVVGDGETSLSASCIAARKHR